MPDDRGEIEQRLQSIASAAFPDDVGVRWHVCSVTRKANFTCIEAEPIPPTVGYPRFRFVLERAASGEMRDLGCYCLDRGAWRLLYTTPETTGEWQRLGFGPASATLSAEESLKQPSVPPKADWSKTHPRAAGGCLALFGLPFVLGGAFAILVALRVLPSGPRDAPLWVIFAAGIAFLVPGLVFFSAGLWTMVTARFPSGQAPVVQGAVVTIVLTCMAVISGGAALFGDPRSFSGRGLTGTVAEKRFWFGLAAVLIGAVTLVFGALTIGAALSRRRSGTDSRRGR